LSTLVAIPIISTGLAQAADLIVPVDHATIQAAIDASNDGDRIIINDGHFSGYVELGTDADNTKNNLTIQAESEGGASIVVSGGGDIPLVYVEGDAGAVPTGTIIDGLNLIRSGSGGKGAAVFLFNSNTTTRAAITVQNCSMSGGGGTSFSSGLRLCGYVEANITDNYITGAHYAGIATSADPNEDYLYADSIVTISGNTIDGNGVTAKAGIFLKVDDSGNTVQVVIGDSGTKQSLVHHNGTAGIRLEDIYGPVTIDSNDIYNNGEAGLCIVDVGSGSARATVRNNNIYSNTEAGITVAGASYLRIGSNNNVYDNGKAGVVFNKGNIESLYGDPINVSSKPVAIRGNDIYSNGNGGISIIDAITGTVTIAQNNIYQNTLGGIGIQNACTSEITRNSLYDNLRGGIHTGTAVADGGGFSGTPGSADLAVGQNKVYRNGQTGYGAGIDVRHASGAIYNNLVYTNHRGGIRFGDYVTEIINNTVVDNGQGGIVYDDLAGAVNDLPDGTLTDSPNYPYPLIRNNISVYNGKTGLRVGRMPTGTTQCPGNPGYNRDHNLLHSNNGTGEDDCGWATGQYDSTEKKFCVVLNYGGCGLTDSNQLTNPNDILADPLFVDRDNDDYHLQDSSPAKNAGDDGNDMGAYGGSDPIDW
jgi:hypothetical protein